MDKDKPKNIPSEIDSVAFDWLAKRFGTSPEDEFAKFDAWLDSSPYPTADCFSPDELAEYAKDPDSISDKLSLHIGQCEHCKSLVARARPNDTR